MSLVEQLIIRLEKLAVEKDKLERKVGELQKIILEDIKENELLPNGFYHNSKLN